MKKIVLHTTFGDYTILYPNGDNGLNEIYRGARRSPQQLGDLVLGSISAPPVKGVSFENGEYVVPQSSSIAEQVRSEARRYDVSKVFNYVVIRDFQGNLRILPLTKSCEDSLTKRIRLAEDKAEVKP